MIQAVLFDFDGLLADSEPLQKAAWRTYLQTHGRTLDRALVDRMFGLRLKESAALVRDVLQLEPPVEAIMAERDAVFLTSLHGALKPMPGAASAIATARQLGLRLALATSGHQRYIELALRELQFEDFFDVIVTGDMVEHGKPAPDIFLTAAELLRVPPATCIVVEDAPHGIAAARAAHMIAIAVPNPMTHDLDLSAAHHIFPSLHAFNDWLIQHVKVEEL
jgi:HAD superfamily hydrolase (TIGR01509 family)